MQTFTSYLIGETALLVECGKKILNSGNKILGGFSHDPHVQSWASDSKIPIFTCMNLFQNILTESTSDYIFSIVNKHILSQALLRTPRQFVINYHDSLLPTYAGSNATSWALINGERIHGITWHVVIDRIDACCKPRSTTTGREYSAN